MISKVLGFLGRVPLGVTGNINKSASNEVLTRQVADLPAKLDVLEKQIGETKFGKIVSLKFPKSETEVFFRIGPKPQDMMPLSLTQEQTDTFHSIPPKPLPKLLDFLSPEIGQTPSDTSLHRLPQQQTAAINYTSPKHLTAAEIDKIQASLRRSAPSPCDPISAENLIFNPEKVPPNVTRGLSQPIDFAPLQVPKTPKQLVDEKLANTVDQAQTGQAGLDVVLNIFKF